ncbi:2-haloalkanoic acid dehalogenase [Penicillium chermesinum]|uniref:2-haloalkanoic acid dehalogenase n=1 Tax=Penicillium chermesinum TaxID=63820 RepID=A0A9W9TRD2_9EURO|nr:2-haloalkanoic acid dehalogenase [Penicillium chermesinum]KAJ5238566.1 2-haloalkanoic acid dehalogenase [Penicillium chermesinum]KAJ6164218.1 2-haloalkanoic acid dehalogenase [Penicillium chermesinum]
MAAPSKHVVFDVVGTCVSYEAFYEAIEARLGEKLRANHIGTRIFGYAWMEAGEREYTYLSLSGHYVKCFDCLHAVFYRTLWQAGIPEPRKFATDEDRDYLLACYRTLKLRPGIAECFARLRNAGFTVWAFTAGDTPRVAGYLAAGGVDMPEENFVSCDTIGIGKPEPSSYKFILDKFKREGEEAETWFASAHMWDSAAAKRNGFKGAWVSVWEKEPCAEIFGEMDVVADDPVSMADKIIAF